MSLTPIGRGSFVGEVCPLGEGGGASGHDRLIEARSVQNYERFLEGQERGLRFVAFDGGRRGNDHRHIQVLLAGQFFRQVDVDLIQAEEFRLRSAEGRRQSLVADLDLKPGDVAPARAVNDQQVGL